MMSPTAIFLRGSRSPRSARRRRNRLDHNPRRRKAGHFGGLAADQGRAGLKAAAAMPVTIWAPISDRACRSHNNQEEQGLGALHDEIVDAHGDEVDPDRIVNAALDGDLTLVPTPSLAATRMDRKSRRLEVEQAPNPPISASAPRRRVARTAA